MAGSKLTLPFEAKETLFYKSVTRVMTLFAFLPSTLCDGRNRKVSISRYFTVAV
jgi:hypothetical protein